MVYLKSAETFGHKVFYLQTKLCLFVNCRGSVKPISFAFKF